MGFGNLGIAEVRERQKSGYYDKMSSLVKAEADRRAKLYKLGIENQIKANLVNYMLTNKGERYMNPSFGSNLRALLFEQIDDSELDDLLEVIQLNVSQEFPTIEVKEISFDTSNEVKDRNEIAFSMTYTVKILGIEDDLQILLQ